MNKIFTTSIIICMMFIASIAWSKIIWVDDDLQDCPDADFTKIQEAIDAAIPGDEVRVCPGVYEENITLIGNIKVIGIEGAGVTTITASSGDIVTADNIGVKTSISGFKIDGQGSSGHGIHCYGSSSPTISKVNISDCADGIHCYGSSSPSISYVTISGVGGDGISCNRSSPSISDVTISGAGRHGIYCYISSPSISYVTIRAGRTTGIYCDSSSLISISKVTINGAGGDGIGFSTSSGTISDVTIIDAGDNGICCVNPSLPITISNCDIRYSRSDGIRCAASSSPTIRESIIIQNYLNGISIDSSSRPDIGTEAEPGLNEIFDNGNYDVYSENTAEIKAELNCWGECPPNPAYFYGNIDYDPWLCTAINGIVTGAGTGNPIKWAFVIAVNADTKDKYIAVTNSEGYFEILGVPSGTYWVICIKKGYKAGIKRVKVACGDTIVVDFKLSPKQE